MPKRGALLALLVTGACLAGTACSSGRTESPTDTGTESNTTSVRAPNGTNMGAPPLNMDNGSTPAASGP